jgi:hypothetical protein
MITENQIIIDLHIDGEKLLISLDLRKLKRVYKEVDSTLDKMSPRPIRENQLFKYLNTFLENNVKEAEIYQKSKYNVLKGIGDGRKKAALYFSHGEKNSLRLMVHKEILEKNLATIYFFDIKETHKWQEMKLYIHDPIQFNESLNSYIAEINQYDQLSIESYLSQKYIDCFDIDFCAKEYVSEILLVPDLSIKLEDALDAFRSLGDPEGLGYVNVEFLKYWFEKQRGNFNNFIDYNKFLSKPRAGFLNVQVEKQYDGTYTLIFGEKDLDILKEFLNLIKNDLIKFTDIN